MTLAERPSANLQRAMDHLGLDVAKLSRRARVEHKAIEGIIERRVGLVAPGGHWPRPTLSSAVARALRLDASYLYLDTDAAALALESPSRRRVALADRPSLNMSAALKHYDLTVDRPAWTKQGPGPLVAARFAEHVWGENWHVQRIMDIIKRRMPGVGLGHWPRPERAEKICAALGVDAAYLYLPPPLAREMIRAVE